MTSLRPSFAVTGATGAVGGRVAARLADAGLRPRLLVRDPARAPELAGSHVVQVAGYHDGDAMQAALEGVQTLLLVSAEEHPQRLAHHRTAVEAASAAGVERIVYTSFVNAAADATFLFARDHHHTEQAIVAAGLGLTALRDSFYLDVLPDLVTDGVVRGPAGDGHLAPVARADVADVAVAAMLDGRLAGEVLDVTGSQRLTMAGVAEELTRSFGTPVRYEDEPVDDAIASREALGAPGWLVRAWVSTYTAIAAGELDVVSDVAERLAGHAPRTLADVVARTGD